MLPQKPVIASANRCCQEVAPSSRKCRCRSTCMLRSRTGARPLAGGGGYVGTERNHFRESTVPRSRSAGRYPSRARARAHHLRMTLSRAAQARAANFRTEFGSRGRPSRRPSRCGLNWRQRWDEKGRWQKEIASRQRSAARRRCQGWSAAKALRYVGAAG